MSHTHLGGQKACTLDPRARRVNTGQLSLVIVITGGYSETQIMSVVILGLLVITFITSCFDLFFCVPFDSFLEITSQISPCLCLVVICVRCHSLLPGEERIQGSGGGERERAGAAQIPGHSQSPNLSATQYYCSLNSYNFVFNLIQCSRIYRME